MVDYSHTGSARDADRRHQLARSRARLEASNCWLTAKNPCGFESRFFFESACSSTIGHTAQISTIFLPIQSFCDVVATVNHRDSEIEHLKSIIEQLQRMHSDVAPSASILISWRSD